MRSPRPPFFANICSHIRTLLSHLRIRQKIVTGNVSHLRNGSFLVALASESMFSVWGSGASGYRFPYPIKKHPDRKGRSGLGDRGNELWETIGYRNSLWQRSGQGYWERSWHRYSEHGWWSMRIISTVLLLLVWVASSCPWLQSNAPGFPAEGVLQHYRRFIQNLQAARFCLSVRLRPSAWPRWIRQPLLFIL